jgi:hypothetical protein
LHDASRRIVDGGSDDQESNQSLLEKGTPRRTTYHDYYDSCHPPVETPDAAWVPAVERNRDPFNREKYQISIGDLKAGGAWPTLKENGIVELSTGWHTYQVRVKQ